MKIKKSIAILLLVATMLTTSVLFCSCGDKEDSKPSKSDSSQKGDSSVKSSDDSSQEDSSAVTTEDSEEPTDSQSEPSAPSPDLSKDWKSYQFQLDGKVFKLPVKLSELKALGYDLTEKGAFDVAPNSEVLAVSVKNSKGNRIAGTFKNLSDKICDVSECYLYEFAVSNWSFNEGIDVVLPGGINFNSTKDDVIKAYGKPSKEVKKDDREILTYTIDKKNQLEIDIVDGIAYTFYYSKT